MRLSRYKTQKNFSNCENLVSMFFNQAEILHKFPFLWYKDKSRIDDKYQKASWGQVADDVKRFAHGLQYIGVEPDSRVVVVSENRPEWLISCLAVMSINCVSVAGYVTNTSDGHAHIIKDADASVIIVSTNEIAKEVLAAVRKSKRPITIIAMESIFGKVIPSNVDMMSWRQVLQSDSKELPMNFPTKPIVRDDTACIVYTSGSGGEQKGIELSHKNIIHNCMGANEIGNSVGIFPNKQEVFLSFLPVSHAYEMSIGMFFPIALGAQLYYSDGFDKLSENIIEANPTFMIAVPRFFEVLRLRILNRVKGRNKIYQKLFKLTIALGKKHYEHPEAMTKKEKLQNKMLDVLIRRSARRKFGIQFKTFVSGGADINYDVALFFVALGVPIMQGYGMTEASPVIACNIPYDNDISTVGRPLLGTEAKISRTGEILVRGDSVMKGYWNDEKGTNKAIDKKGWLHTGDVGEINDKGHIIITGRKKDIIVNSGGDNISPQRVEGFLAYQPEISHALIYGDGKPHIVAVVVASQEFIEDWTRFDGQIADMVVLKDDPDFVKAISEAVDRVNDSLSPIEKIRRFIIAKEPFSVKNGLMTPTMKIRRYRIIDKYKSQLNALYKKVK
ncbi:MAG: long-chain fatty acid--CoA ligase [Alphaproteobacteria bacterium]|nr:long-chain fatty acid--CoA ligase [Alphaproteobacteria bacterium]